MRRVLPAITVVDALGLGRAGAGPETAGLVGFVSAAGLLLVSVWRGWNVPRLGGNG